MNVRITIEFAVPNTATLEHVKLLRDQVCQRLELPFVVDTSEGDVIELEASIYNEMAIES